MIQSWMVIGGITFLVALGAAWIRPRDTKWAADLQRPLWLFFEPLIPVIWTVIFSCGAASAYFVWEQSPGSLQVWLLMALYLLLEVITVAYIPLTLRLRNIKVGVVLGGIGVVLGVFLASSIWPISGWAALLLLPYLIWGPIGTYATLEMMRLNPEAAH
jgi:benzodiazapine receptor